MTAAMFALLIVAQAPVTAPTARVLVIGDSLTAAGTIVDRVHRRLPWVDWVGGTASSWGASHCGYSGYSAKSFVDVEAVPFSADSAFDMGAYFTAHGTPTLVVISVGINNIYLVGEPEPRDTRITEEMADVDAMIVEARAHAGADVPILVTSPGDTTGAYATYQAAVEAAWTTHYDGRSAEHIYYLAYQLQPSADYGGAPDYVHPDAYGYERMAWQLAAQICVIAGCP